MSPRLMMRLHLGLTVLWAVMIPVAIVTGWLLSVAFIAAISIYANLAGHFSSYQAARTELRQQGDSNDLSDE